VVTSPVNYCQNATAIPLTATGTGLLWYTTVTGGTGTITAPTPSTAVAGTISYYVSQTNNCGESPRGVISVTVTATPAAPSGLNVAAVTMNTAVLNWTGVAGNFYTVDYKAASSATWINLANAINNSSVNVANLVASTIYDWRVSANCNASPINNYAAAQFTTSSHNNNITHQKNGFGIKISPDPVTGNATVDYIVPGNGTVSITVIDAFGQQLKTLYNASQNQGQYTLTITNQLNNLNKGCYFLRIQQNGRGYFTQFLKQ